MAEVLEAGERRPADGRRRLWIWLGVAVLLIALVAGGFYITEQPWFCSGSVCHEMTRAYDGWEVSPHPNVGCTDCHAAPGVVGFLEAHVQDGLRDVWIHFTDRPETVPRGSAEPIEPEWCLERCHGEQFEALEEDRREDVENPLPERHPERDSDCPECHYDEAHEPE